MTANLQPALHRAHLTLNECNPQAVIIDRDGVEARPAADPRDPGPAQRRRRLRGDEAGAGGRCAGCASPCRRPG